MILLHPGKRSCHIGVQKNAGWVMPVGTLMGNGQMKCVNDNQYASVAAFFNASCAPGLLNLMFRVRTIWFEI